MGTYTASSDLHRWGLPMALQPTLPPLPVKGWLMLSKVYV